MIAALLYNIVRSAAGRKLQNSNTSTDIEEVPKASHLGLGIKWCELGLQHFQTDVNLLKDSLTLPLQVSLEQKASADLTHEDADTRTSDLQNLPCQTE